MKKLFDTNVIMDYPSVILEPDTVLNLYVLRELDVLKNDRDPARARKAREAVRFIFKHLDEIVYDETYLPSRDTDEALIDMCLANKYTLVTNDINLHIRAHAKRVDCCSYQPEDQIITNTWKTEVTLSEEEMAAFYNGAPLAHAIRNHQYVFIKNDKGQIVDKYYYHNHILQPVRYKTIHSDYLGKIKPRNIEQECAFHMLDNSDSKVKVLTGRYGSGKTFSMLSKAIESLMSGKFDKIVYVRNNINVRDTVELGSLPGDEIEKLYPFLMPLADKVGGKDALDHLIENGQIEPIHLGYLRGRDLSNCLIYCTEAQNLTTDHVKLLLGRVGEGSELWLDGDFKAQVDRKIFQEDNGLRNLILRLNGNPYFTYVNLEKSERSKVAALADLLD